MGQHFRWKTVATDIELDMASGSGTFTAEVTDGVLNVEVGSPRRNSKQDPILNFIKVRAVEESLLATEYDSLQERRG